MTVAFVQIIYTHVTLLVCLLSTDFGAGGDCFTTTFEVTATEFVLSQARALGLDLTATNIREYVLCDGQTYPISRINQDRTVVGGAGFDYQLLVINPNLKITCNSCILQASLPTGLSSPGYFVVGTPSTLNFTLPADPAISGFILDGVTITQLPGSEELSSPIGVSDFEDLALPVQIRNVVVRDISNAEELIVILTAQGKAMYELSNVTVKVCSNKTNVSLLLGPNTHVSHTYYTLLASRTR